ncbi:MAG: extracellular solute-binding protein [Clostridiaceae bacterium]|nr:extracellular solute-binding protein [Clostridia bacterium]NLV34648.1 extracellular solute-binding protein [Clostridiaceae bacterium]
MKKVKVLSLVLCLILVCSLAFTACDNKPTETASEQPTETATETATETQTEEPKEVEKPRRMDMTVLYFYGDATDNATQKFAFKNYVSRTYGIDFYFNTPARDTYIETINLQAVSGDLTGLVYLFTGYEMIAWAQEGIILALDEYLKDNETWINIISEEWKELYTWDGHVWGIPKGDDGAPSYFIRTMRGDWLEAVGMSKPETIDTFYEVVKAFTYNDPDRNGQNDTWGFCSRNVWLMQDMFQAHDARLNHVADVLPIWNPNKDIWEDSVIKPEMVEAVTFLRKCYSEGLVHPELFSMSSTNVRNLVSNGQAGSCYYWDTWLIAWENAVKANNPSAYMVGIGAISKTITTKINQWGGNAGGGAPYVLMANTEQPKEFINWFITLMWGSPETFFTFRYGIPQADKNGKEGYYLDGKTVYLLYHQYNAETETVQTGATPQVTAGHPSYALDVGPFGYVSAYNSGKPSWDADQVNIQAANLRRRYDVLNEYNDGRLYILPESMKEPDMEAFTSIKGEWATAGLKYVSDCMVEGIAPREALKSYLTVVMAFNPQAVLDTMNQRLGKTTEQNYATVWSSMN